MAKDFKQTDFLFGCNSVYIEELYQQYQLDPSSVDNSWREFFENYPDSKQVLTAAKVINTHGDNFDAPKTISIETEVTPDNWQNLAKLKARFMIKAYREHGHLLANLDPLGLEKLPKPHELRLTLSDFGINDDEAGKNLELDEELARTEAKNFKVLEQYLQHSYCGSIGCEFSHIEDFAEQEWLFDEFEHARLRSQLSIQQQLEYLQDLIEIEGFEQYLHSKFPGAKRFSIEGGESSIVALDTIIELAAKNGAKDVVLGMAHRGRLSTLTKVMEKPYRAVISEFMGGRAFPADLQVAGDVKYHMGYSSDKTTRSGQQIHLSLTPNPSHLEAVNPVVAGKVRAKQDLNKQDRTSTIGILVHGDTAFCGQGIVAEGLSMTGLRAYDVGGIFHIVINNQIGFTVDKRDSRSGRYCTEVAKMAGAPILHVNGDDIEAVIIATEIAAKYRNKFAKDVVLDIVCYRKYGHNEGDEPMYTQSVMYNAIKQRDTTAKLYSDSLVASGVIDLDYYSNLKAEFKQKLDAEYSMVERYKPRAQWLEGQWQNVNNSKNDAVSTGVDIKILKKIGKVISQIPDGMDINKKLIKLLEGRDNSIQNGFPIDWATAELLAYGTLLHDKVNIRISGQDAQRGTFSHRHAVMHSQSSNKQYTPLEHVAKDQGRFEIYNSNLSEYGVLGFEYGYSLVNPNNLVIWEAQFGDFSNGAQIMFDQFITSAETKWLRLSGLVMLLPHGYEGQGPEHSSARLERFLQQCAKNNIQVAYPTTPASIFHLLRRQIVSSTRRPLIIMSPKSVLRHKSAVSDLQELALGEKFQPVIDEINKKIKASAVTRLVFCSGKVYYDLLSKREENNLENVAIIRLEQLYPLPSEEIAKILNKYKSAKEFIWAQEEPQNMGAWQFINTKLSDLMKECAINKTLQFIGREEAASPAVGYLYVHNKEQENLVNKALIKS